MTIRHSAKEESIGSRPQTKTYYYIHNTEAIDAIKWKVYTMKNMLEEQVGAESQPHGFACDVCKSRYSSIDIIDTFSPEKGGFICGVCGNVLHEEDVSTEQYAGQEKLGKMMNQIQPIIEALKKIDESFIPENTFQSSLAIALPIPKVNEYGNVISTSQDNNRSRMGDGLSVASNKANVPQSTFQVKITSDQENMELEKKQREEKARLAEENALPQWHVESTVGKSLYSASDVTTDNTESGTGVNIETSDSKDSKSGSVDPSNEETLAAFYAQLAARQREEEAEEEDEEDEEDEDEMEEVDMEAADEETKKPTGGDDDEDEDEDDDDEDEFEDVTV